MGECRNCKYWSREYEGICDKVDRKQDREKTDGTNFEVCSYASDDTGLISQLRTGPRFGCVQFVPKKK